MKAYDVDSGINGKIGYKIERGFFNLDYFEVDQNGIVTSIHQLDREVCFSSLFLLV